MTLREFCTCVGKTHSYPVATLFVYRSDLSWQAICTDVVGVLSVALTDRFRRRC